MAQNPSINVHQVAKLARLELDPAAEARLQSDMEEILQYVNQLAELDVSGVEPTAYAVPLSNVIRADAAAESFPRQTMLSNAPELAGSGEFVKVPRVLPNEEE